MIKILYNSLLNMFAKNLDLLSFSSARALLHARTRRVSRPRAVRCCGLPPHADLLPCMLLPCCWRAAAALLLACCCLLLSCWPAAELRAAAALLSCVLLLPCC